MFKNKKYYLLPPVTFDGFSIFDIYLTNLYVSIKN